VVHDVDLALDAVGEATLLHTLETLKRGGTLISIAGPPPLEQAQARGVRALMSRGAASVPFRALSQMIEEDQLGVTVGKTFALSKAQQAHERANVDMAVGGSFCASWRKVAICRLRHSQRLTRHHATVPRSRKKTSAPMLNAHKSPARWVRRSIQPEAMSGSRRFGQFHFSQHVPQMGNWSAPSAIQDC
jgi:hypothetical protein